MVGHAVLRGDRHDVTHGAVDLDFRERRKLLLGHLEGDVAEEHYIERDLAMRYDAACSIRLNLSKAKVIPLPLAAVGTEERREQRTQARDMKVLEEWPSGLRQRF